LKNANVLEDNNDLDIDGITSEDDFVNNSIAFRNRLIKFEQVFYQWYNSLEPGSQLSFIHAMLDYCNDSNNRITNDLIPISSNIRTLIEDKEMYYYLMLIATDNTEAFYSQYKAYVDNLNGKAAFDTQEEVISSAMRFILNTNKDEYDK
jgi:hypothetical protein